MKQLRRLWRQFKTSLIRVKLGKMPRKKLLLKRKSKGKFVIRNRSWELKQKKNQPVRKESEVIMFSLL